MNPFFITGVSRSGTSYLYDLLNGHPQIRLSYEGRLFTEGWHCYRRYGDLTDRQCFGRLVADLVDCNRGERLNRWIGRSMSESVNELFDRHLAEPTFSRLIENIYQLPGPVSCWGNKMLRLEMSSDILDHWPGAKFVGLIRDPRAVYASQKIKFPDRRMKYSAIYWNLHAAAVRENRLPKEQFLLIKYEDMVHDAATHLKRILNFVGLWDEEMAAQMLKAHPASTMSVDKWRTSLGENEILTIESICYDQMMHFGYVPQLADSRSKLSTLTKAFETFMDNRQRIPLEPSVWKRKKVLWRFLSTIRSKT